MAEQESSQGIDDSTTEYLDANGLRFAYQSYPQSDGQSAGDSNLPAIVLIRGLGTQMIQWSPILIDQLTSGGFRVVIFDNRDVGLSSKLNVDYELNDMADDVLGLMAALGESRFHVFGISLGGMVAQLVVARHPQVVRSLFSVMSTSGNPDLPRSAGSW